MPTPKQQRRRALELLEASIDGCTEAIMLAFCVSGDRCGDAVGTLHKAAMQRTPASRKGSAKNRGNSCQRKHPAEILALGPSCATTRATVKT